MDERDYILAIFFFGGMSMTASAFFILRKMDEQRLIKPPDRETLIKMTIVFWDGLGMAAAGALLWLLDWALDWPFLVLAFAVIAAMTIYGLRQAIAKFPVNDR